MLQKSAETLNTRLQTDILEIKIQQNYPKMRTDRKINMKTLDKHAQ